MLIIRINANQDPATIVTRTQIILAAAADGVVVVPSDRNLDNVPARWIQIEEKDADRVAALEAELAAALADLSEVKTCESCKHEPVDPGGCFETGYACKSCEEPGCVCHDCDAGSKWEWRHAQAVPGAVSKAGEHSNRVAAPAETPRPQKDAQLAENRDCATCKHDEYANTESCAGSCLTCNKTRSCPCAYCRDGNRWESGDSHGAE